MRVPEPPSILDRGYMTPKSGYLDAIEGVVPLK